jgi:hypothetical protein
MGEKMFRYSVAHAVSRYIKSITHSLETFICLHF